jgi:hypothetical protein
MVDKKQVKRTGAGGLAGPPQGILQGQDGSAPRVDGAARQRAPVRKQQYRPKLFGKYKVGAVECIAVPPCQLRTPIAKKRKVWVLCDDGVQVRTELHLFPFVRRDAK